MPATLVFRVALRYTSFVHRWWAIPICVASLAGQVPAERKLVAVADHAELYEVERSGERVFPLLNQVDLRLERYAIEVWTRNPREPRVRWCRVAEARVAIGREARELRQGCQLPVDSRTGKAVVHSTRIVELNWERGLRWRATVVPAAHPPS